MPQNTVSVLHYHTRSLMCLKDERLKIRTIRIIQYLKLCDRGFSTWKTRKQDDVNKTAQTLELKRHEWILDVKTAVAVLMEIICKWTYCTVHRILKCCAFSYTVICCNTAHEFTFHQVVAVVYWRDRDVVAGFLMDSISNTSTLHE